MLLTVGKPCPCTCCLQNWPFLLHTLPCSAPIWKKTTVNDTGVTYKATIQQLGEKINYELTQESSMYPILLGQAALDCQCHNAKKHVSLFASLHCTPEYL